MGVEYPASYPWIVGWRGLLAVYSQSGTFTFPGPTYGNYVEAIPTRSKVVVGPETYLGYETKLSNRFNLRATGRLGFGLTGVDSSTEPPPRYVPGLGLCVGRTFLVGAGLGVQLLYQAGRTVRPANANL